MYKILVIDDAIEIQLMLKAVLTPLNMNIHSATSISEAKMKIEQNNFDLFIIDLNLADGDGLELLCFIRENSHYKMTPAIVLSSKTDIAFKLSAFSLGADDYVTKPFNSLEFKARVESVLRRTSFMRGEEGLMTVGPFVFEPSKQNVTIIDTQEQINLTSTEYRILLLFARRPDVIFSRNQILDHVWGFNVSVTDRTVDSHIYSLRKKLGMYSACIQCVQGEGYRFLEKVPLYISKSQPNNSTNKIFKKI